ncbi:MAG: LuxR C-terminal-related transcriptional regulator [Chloroflexi bacterium]|nr:LuxR C-terminal-related transcriptional regulator [Chloroflexota bacterium]
MTPAELRGRRRALGLTQANLAAVLDVSANTVARWERGELRVGRPGRVARCLEQLERRPAEPALDPRAPFTAAPMKVSRSVTTPAGQVERPAAVPGELSSFVGRELELRHVRRLLESTRLLTLTGTGGVGKTRLALALLQEVKTDSRAAPVFVDLAPLTDPALVPQTVASAVGAREQPGRSLVATLIDVIHRRRLLVVLDNCEHLVYACAALADELLPACPNLRLLTTSREPFGLAGETVWRVPSLLRPEPEMAPDHIERTEAVRLFVERARAVLPELDLQERNLRAVADICRRLDGIPLALELAAAHVPMLSLEQLAARLEDALGLLTSGGRLAPARQQTVRATLDWSYRLLTLEAGSEAPRARDRHAVYFLAMVEQTEPELFGQGHLVAQARLEREHDNCRAALGWLAQRAETEAAQRLAGALGRFWFYRGYLTESAVWMERVLALPDGARRTAGRAKCLWGCVGVSLSRADYVAVEQLGQEARALWHEVGNVGEEGFALFGLGFVARLRGDFPRARALLEEGLGLCRTGHHGAGETNCLWSLAELASGLGDDREARVWAEAALARATEVGWTIGVAVARRVLGAVHARRGEYGAAAVLLEASLTEARALGARWWIAETLAQLGQLALTQGNPGLAAMRFGESLALARDLADRAGIVRALEGIAQLAVLRRAPRQALQLAAAAAALRETMRAPLAATDRLQLERRLAPARRTLGEPAAEAACAEGGAVPVQQAIDLALVHAQPESPARSAATGCSRLTERELTVTRLVAQGLTNRQIAEHLVIAEGTAERHVGNILAKLDMSTRSQIAAWAVGLAVLQRAPNS